MTLKIDKKFFSKMEKLWLKKNVVTVMILMKMFLN